MSRDADRRRKSARLELVRDGEHVEGAVAGELAVTDEEDVQRVRCQLHDESRRGELAHVESPREGSELRDSGMSGAAGG